MSSNPCIYMDYGQRWRPFKRQAKASCGCMAAQVKVRVCGLLPPTLNGGPCLWRKRPWRQLTRKYCAKTFTFALICLQSSASPRVLWLYTWTARTPLKWRRSKLSARLRVVWCCSIRDQNCQLENLGITVQYRVKVRLILGFGIR